MFVPIVCPDCGATGIFEQRGPDTYYCDYHKGSFKQFDRNRVTVRNVGYFCSCSHRIKYQCQLCKRGICDECDVIESQNRLHAQREFDYSEMRATYGRLVVPVQRLGYLEVVHHAKIWMISENRVDIFEMSHPVIGPFLTLGDIWPQVTTDPETLRHVCCQCVGARAPLAAAAVAAGSVCEHPGCGAVPGERCRCCGKAFCAQHFKENVAMLTEVDCCPMCVDEVRLLPRRRTGGPRGGNPLGRIFGFERKAGIATGKTEGTPPACRRGELFDQQVDMAREDSRGGSSQSRAHDSLYTRDFLISTYKVVGGRGV